jgi:hypothetical protein
MSEANADVAQRGGIPRLLWGMIVRPRATLETLNERGGPTWWVPALLAALMIVLPVIVGIPIRTRETREAMLAAQEQFGEQQDQEMSAEEQAQMEQAMSVAASPLITAVFPAVGGVVVRVLSWLVWAGALYLAGMTLGGRSTFGQMFRMVVWTWLPYALRGLIQTIYIVISGQIIANQGLSGFVRGQQTVEEMVAAPLSPGQTFLAAFLSKVDLYLIWNLILLVIGVKVITHLPRRKAIVVTLGVWVLMTALGLAPKLIGSLFTRQMSGF